jgi:hypothetical protein
MSFVILILFSAVLFAQTGANSAAASNSAVADQLKQLQDALAAQQKQIAVQQQEIEALRTQLSKQGEAHVVDATMHPGSSAEADAVAAIGQPSAAPEDQKDNNEAPLSFRIGAANFTPGGWVDFTNVFRSANTGNPIGTNFGQIPFSNTVGGHLTEYRSTAQHSRLSLKVDSNYHDMKIVGYVEADFNGNDPTNIFVSSNSHTARMRLYQVDLKRSKWEVLAGQTWSLLTPNRVGISGDPADVFNTRNMDPNYQVGLVWARQAGFRFGYHPDEHWAWGVSIENPQQFIGITTNVAQVIFPQSFNALLSPQLDNGSLPGTPNMHPDIISKLTYDHNFGGDRHFHGELAGLLSSVKVTQVGQAPTDTGFISHAKTGGGGSAAVLVDLFKQFKLVGTAFYSDGGGRYIFGLGPQTVVRPELDPRRTVTPFFDTNPSLVHSGSGILGFEAPVSKSITLAGYYGGAYFQRNTFADLTATTGLPGVPISCAPHQPLLRLPCIGFGGFAQSGSSAQNRALQEGTFDWIQTFFKDPKYGSLQLIMQYSYLTRATWFIPAGAPKNAHLSMAYVNLRYVLP